MDQHKRWTNAVVALAAILVVACGTANAQEKAFRITGAGTGPDGLPLPGQDPRPHWAIGEGTHLGKYYGEGAVETVSVTGFDPATGIITGTFGSAEPFVFTGADSDELACHYGRVDFGASEPGQFMLVPLGGGYYIAFWIAEFVPVDGECTGKFAGVSGGWTMYAMSEPFVLGSTDPIGYSWEGKGRLTFAKPK